jgi:hypothetical protein
MVAPFVPLSPVVPLQPDSPVKPVLVLGGFQGEALLPVPKMMLSQLQVDFCHAGFAVVMS